MHCNVMEKNLVYLMQLEKEMLDWGVSGFLPMGPASFQTNESQSYPLVMVGHNMVSVSMSTSMAAAGGSTLTSTIKDKTAATGAPSVTNSTTSSFPTNVASMGVKVMHQMQGRKVANSQV